MLQAWVRQLYRDYDHLCFMYRLKLRRPVIAVEPMKSHWGKWDPITRTIVISQSLIETYPWDAVLEILRHEMAHQLAWEEWGIDDGHGPQFRRACQKLGTAVWAMRAESELGVPLKTQVPAPEQSEEARLFRRVEKLLALASSQNEHEALAAMQKVRELYAKYHLERKDHLLAEDHVSLVIHTGRKRLSRHHYLACSLLNDHFFVRVIHGSLYDARRNGEYKCIELLGTRENTQMAEYVYHFLMNQAEHLWQRARLQGGVLSRRCYVLGVFSGFRSKLEASRKSAKQSGSVLALVPVRDATLEAYVQSRFPRLVSIRASTLSTDARSFEAGKREGERLVLHKGISQSEGFAGRFLGKGNP